MKTNGLPELWHFRVSHYNEKVRWALDYKSVPHLRHDLIPGFHIPVARWLSAQNQLPILRVDGKVFYDSSVILEELERVYSQPRLFPEAPEELQRALELQSYYDDEVAPALRRLFWSTYIQHPAWCARMATDGYGAISRVLWRASLPFTLPLYRRNMGLDRVSVRNARSNLKGYFDRLEQQVGPHGFLVGNHFSVADLTAAAVMTAIVRPPEFPYPLPEPWSEELLALREQVSSYPACNWVLDIYKNHRGRSCENDAQQVAAGDV